MTSQKESEFLQDDDVISLIGEEDTLFHLGRTYKVDELIEKISDVLYHKWNDPEREILSNGIEYEVLRVEKSGGWRKGKVKLKAVFYPEESNLDSELETLRQSADLNISQPSDL